MARTSRTAPKTLQMPCPDCGVLQLHDILGGRLTDSHRVTLSATVRCRKCKSTRHATFSRPKDIAVPTVVSEFERSRKARVLLPPDEELKVGQTLLVDGVTTAVTTIEVASGYRERAAARDVKCLWTRRSDLARVKVSVNLGRRTRSFELRVDPDEEFEVDSVIEVDGRQVRVHSIKTGRASLRRGRAPARDIRTMFARPVRAPGKPEAAQAQRGRLARRESGRRD